MCSKTYLWTENTKNTVISLRYFEEFEKRIPREEMEKMEVSIR